MDPASCIINLWSNVAHRRFTILWIMDSAVGRQKKHAQIKTVIWHRTKQYGQLYDWYLGHAPQE